MLRCGGGGVFGRFKEVLLVFYGWSSKEEVRRGER